MNGLETSSFFFFFLYLYNSPETWKTQNQEDFQSNTGFIS
jgi:hypothetical protein